MATYHFRDILGTVQLNNSGSDMECYEGFEDALRMAYSISADTNKTIYVCRGSSGNELPSFTEIASVKAMP